MPYASTPGSPDFSKVLRTRDPKWATRPPLRNSRRNNHRHAPTRIVGTRTQLGEPEWNELHGSMDTYYRYDVDFPCNVTVLPVNDARIEWKYDRTARQSARPYISTRAPPPDRT